jgi:uncharacterized protein YndB with AHSA1/START domain
MPEKNRPPEDEQPLARPVPEQELARPVSGEQEETPRAEEEKRAVAPQSEEAPRSEEEKGLVERVVEKAREKGLVDKADRAVDEVRDKLKSAVEKAREKGLVDKANEALGAARDKLTDGQQVVHFEASVEIEQPVEKVFDYVTDPETLSEWAGPVIEVRDVQRAEPDRLQEGDKFTTVATFLGRRFETPCEVIDYLSNRQFSFRSTGGPVPQKFTYTFEPTLEGTLFTQSVEAESGTFFKLTGPLFEAAGKRQINNDLATLKDLLEV